MIMQLAIVILLVVACAGFLSYQAYRYFKPKPGNKICAGGCCDGEAPKPAAQTGPRTVMISSDDLRNRLKARK